MPKIINLSNEMNIIPIKEKESKEEIPTSEIKKDKEDISKEEIEEISKKEIPKFLISMEKEELIE